MFSIRVRRLLVVLTLLAPLVAGELGIRALIESYRLPFAQAHRPDFEIMWANLARAGQVDILILGDSVSQQSIEPTVLERLVQRETGSRVTVFTAASPGGGLGVNASVVEALAAEHRLPPVLIVGVYSGTLSTDSTFQETFSRTPMGRDFTACQVPLSLTETMDCQLGRISALWRWRGHLEEVLTAVMQPLSRTDNTDALHLRADGFREGRGRTIAQLERQLERADLEKRRFTFPPEVGRSWDWLVATAREEGSIVVPIAFPDTPQMQKRMEEVQPGREGMYREAVDVLETAGGIDFIGVPEYGSWWGDGMARNINHLSVRGARKFTRQLWGMRDFRSALLSGLGLDTGRAADP